MKRAVFAGSFDPFTVGHEDTVKKSLMIFDEVVVAVADNKSKHCRFTAEARAAMIEAVYREEARVRVVRWAGAIVDLLKRENTPFYVRGVRNTVDFEYETEDFYASRDLDGGIVTLYIPSEREHVHVSSTLVKNCIDFEKPYERYVPRAVYKAIGGR